MLPGGPALRRVRPARPVPLPRRRAGDRPLGLRRRPTARLRLRRREDDRLRAARLAGAAAAQEVTIGAGLGTIVGNREGWRTPVELTEAETAARAEGQKMNLDEAVAYALESDRAVEAGT